MAGCAKTCSDDAVGAGGSGRPPPPDSSAAAALPESASAFAPTASAVPPQVEDPRDGSSAALDGGPPAASPSVDAGSSSCKLTYGPAEQPFRGPAALLPMAPAATELRLVANDLGKPRIFTVPIGPSTSPPPKPASFVGVRWPPCRVAARWAYCQGPGGIVYRTTLGTTDTKEIAKSRPNTRISAAAVGEDHAVVAYLQSRKTTEGEMLQAFATLDDGASARLSEEGAGATVVEVVSRGNAALAVYIDARTAMVPVHARSLAAQAGTLALGPDAVLFVSGPPERGIDFALAGGRNFLFALLPTARETSDFGVAAIPIADPPKDNVPAVWSLYPNGLDPAPIAATTGAKETNDVVWVARVRPAEKEPGSPRVLELGRLDATGAFSSAGIVSTGKRITDLAMAADASGAVWLLYGDANATWLERRVCR